MRKPPSQARFRPDPDGTEEPSRPHLEHGERSATGRATPVDGLARQSSRDRTDTGCFAGEAFLPETRGEAGGAGGRRRPTLRDTDRLTDALRVTPAVLRRVVADGERDGVEMEALRSAIAAADAALGGAA